VLLSFVCDLDFFIYAGRSSLHAYTHPLVHNVVKRFHKPESGRETKGMKNLQAGGEQQIPRA
jgi:hypothetical protein